MENDSTRDTSEFEFIIDADDVTNKAVRNSAAEVKYRGLDPKDHLKHLKATRDVIESNLDKAGMTVNTDSERISYEYLEEMFNLWLDDKLPDGKYYEIMHTYLTPPGITYEELEKNKKDKEDKKEDSKDLINEDEYVPEEVDLDVLKKLANDIKYRDGKYSDYVAKLKLYNNLIEDKLNKDNMTIDNDSNDFSIEKALEALDQWLDDKLPDGTFYKINENFINPPTKEIVIEEVKEPETPLKDLPWIGVEEVVDKILDNQLNKITDEELNEFIKMTRTLSTRTDVIKDKKELVVNAQRYKDNDLPLNYMMETVAAYCRYIQSNEYQEDLKNGNVSEVDLKIDLTDSSHKAVKESAYGYKYHDLKHQDHLYHIQGYRKAFEDAMAEAGMVVDVDAEEVTYDELKLAFNKWASDQISDTEYFKLLDKYLTPPGILKSELEKREKDKNGDGEDDNKDASVNNPDIVKDNKSKPSTSISTKKEDTPIVIESVKGDITDHTGYGVNKVNVGDMVQITPGAINYTDNSTYPTTGYIATGNNGYGTISDIYESKMYPSSVGVAISIGASSTSTITVDSTDISSTIYNPSNYQAQSEATVTRPSDGELDQKYVNELLRKVIEIDNDLKNNGGKYKIGDLTAAMKALQNYTHSTGSSGTNNGSGSAGASSITMGSPYAPANTDTTSWTSGVSSQPYIRTHTPNRNGTIVDVGSPAVPNNGMLSQGMDVKYGTRKN